jgi:hypothetical protein
MRHLLLALAGAVLVATSVSRRSAQAEDGAAAGAGIAPAAAQGVAWVDGWEAGKQKAAHAGRLMLVYVHRTSPP